MPGLPAIRHFRVAVFALLVTFSVSLNAQAPLPLPVSPQAGEQAPMRLLPSMFSGLNATVDLSLEQRPLHPIQLQIGDLNASDETESTDERQIVIEARYISVDPSLLPEMLAGIEPGKFELSRSAATLFPGMFEFDLLQKAEEPIAIGATFESRPVVTGIISDAEQMTLWQACKSDIRCNITQAPTVAMYDGQDAVVMDGTVRPFVVCIDVLEDEQGRQAHQPVVQTIEEGMIIRFQATSVDSAIRLQAIVVQNQIESVETVKVLFGEAAGASLQVPRCRANVVKVDKTIGDGEILLIDSGFERIVEQRAEPTAMQRVPVVGRLVSDKLELVPRRTLIMLRAVIIDP